MSLVLAQRIGKRLERLIPEVSTVHDKATVVDVGARFLNALLKHYRVDEDMLEDIEYELNQYIKDIDRERINFLYDRFVRIFTRVNAKLQKL